MKKRLPVILLLPVLFMVTFCLSGQEGINKYYIGIELNGILCGYSEVLVKDPGAGDNDYIAIDQKTFISFKALGRDIVQNQLFTYHLNPSDGNFAYHNSYMEQGESRMSSSMTVDGDTVYIKAGDEQEETGVYIPAGTILPNTMFFPHLRDDFGIKGLESEIYRVFNVRTGTVDEVEYNRVKREQVELKGKKYDAVVVSESDPGTGLVTTYWIDIESGFRIRMESQNNIKMYLADISVVSELKTGNWDDIIFIKTNRKIGDIRKISAMSVRANLEIIPAAGMDDLVFEGQSFNGKISGNSVEGIFEIKHGRYRGENAPAFGDAAFHGDEVGRYLVAEAMIESSNPELGELSLEIVKGSSDCWEAVCRLSRWVEQNIDGSIFGTSALETYKRGNGSCGSQSFLLAALCRAAGIPSRVVWGCLYTPEYDGSFGHHAWSEVYMGDAGWIPLDVTINETDYVDSGHIRLGILETITTVINFKEMTILDYSVNR